MKNCSLGIMIRDSQIFLGEKLQGFAKGVLNGIGGKKDGNETMEECMIREAKEEIGITVQEKDLKKVGVLDFEFSGKPDWNHEVHIYNILDWSGKIQESDEIKPLWFDVDSIPYDKMWPDDIIWLPEVLEGKYVKYKFILEGEGKQSKIVKTIKL